MENKTMKELEDLAKQNNYDAMFEIGTRYFKIDNYSKARIYFKMAADNGHEESIKMLKDNKGLLNIENIEDITNEIEKELTEISDVLKKMRTEWSEDVILRNIEMIQQIIKEYRKNGINDLVLNKLENVAEYTIKGNNKDSYCIDIAKQLYQILIILNLFSNKDFNFPEILQQCRDINKVKGMFRQNSYKLNYQKEEIKERFIDAIKLLEYDKDDKTLNLILNIIDESFPKKKK